MRAAAGYREAQFAANISWNGANYDRRFDMFDLIAEQRVPLGRLCQRFGVRRLEAFGSVLRPDFRPNSDIDLLVEFDRDCGLDAFEQYFGFKEGAERLLGRDIDLTVADAVRNPIFQAEVQRTKTPVYVAA